MRSLALCLALAACSGTGRDGETPSNRSPAKHREIALDDVLPCVVDATMARIAKSPKASEDLLYVALASADPLVRRAGEQFLKALVDQAVGRRLPLAAAVVRTNLAFGFLELGNVDEAARVAEEALAGIDGLAPLERDAVLEAAALMITAAGREPPRAAVERGETYIDLRIVEGFARSGRMNRARELLARLPRPVTVSEKLVYVTVAGWMGDDVGARALLAVDRSPLLAVWYGRALADSRAPDSMRRLDALIDDYRRSADGFFTSRLDTAYAWGQLVRIREELEPLSAQTARVAFDDWLLAADDERAQMRNYNLTVERLYGNTTESRRLRAGLVLPLTPVQQLYLAVLDGDLDEALAKVEGPPASTFAEDASPFALWLLLSRQHVSERDLRRFRDVVCRS